MEIGDILKKALLTGVGAVATTVEVAGDVIDVLSKKGEETVEQGKVLNEERKRNAKEKIKDRVTINVVKETIDLESLSKEEREILKKKLAELENEPQKEESSDKEEVTVEEDCGQAVAEEEEKETEQE